MKKISILILLQILLFKVVVAQDLIEKFGEVSIADLEMETYEKDKGAEAFVIFDFGASSFVKNDYKFDLLFHRTTRVKILSESGLDYAEILIPYYVNKGLKDKVYDIEGIVYNLENGSIKITKLKELDHFDERVSEHYILRKFVLPNVKKGSVIEYTYKILSTYKANLQDWEFQWDIPVVHSEYQISLIPFYKYTWLLQGANSFYSRDSRKATGLKRQFRSVSFYDQIKNFVMKDIPAFKVERFITSRNDYIIKLDYQLVSYINTQGMEEQVRTTWPKLVKERLNRDNFGKYINKSAKSAPKLIDVDALSSKPEKERFEEVMNYVKNNYNWNKRNAPFATETFKDFMKEKKGNSANINLFAIGLLKKVGLEASGVMSSTRSHGIIKYDYPFLHFFNYVLIAVKIDGQEYIADATNHNLTNQRIPEKCINDKGLVIAKGEPRWIKLTSNVPSEKNYEFEVSFGDEESNYKVMSKFSEYDAAKMRAYANDDSKNINDLLLSSGGIIDEESIKITHLNDIDKDLLIEFDYISEDGFTADKIFYSPFSSKLISENPFKQNSRVYPIDMVYAKKRSYKTSINIPDGYKLDYLLSEAKNIDNDNFQLSYLAEEIDGKVIIELMYYFKKYVYPASTYSDIKSYYDEIVKLGAEKVVFIKLDEETKK